jgi:hypothetical protein
LNCVTHKLKANPFKLIQKCEDKHLDSERAARRYKAAERDPEKQRALKGETDLAESTYKALYTQLNQELPRFITMADAFFARVLDGLLGARLSLTKSCLAVLEPCMGFVRMSASDTEDEIKLNHDEQLRAAAEQLVKTSHIIPLVFAKEFRFESYVNDRPARLPTSVVCGARVLLSLCVFAEWYWYARLLLV